MLTRNPTHRANVRLLAGELQLMKSNMDSCNSGRKIEH